MTTQSSRHTTPPLFIIAAIAVILVSTVAIAAMMGWLPSANSGSSTMTGASTTASAPKPSFLAALQPKCTNCGTVDTVTTQTVQGQGSGVGAVVGGVLGGVLGNQVGGGRGKDAATVVGVVGGAYAGNEVEKNNKRTYRHVVRVRLDDGSTRTFTYNNPPAWRSGDRVKVEGNALLRAP